MMLVVKKSLVSKLVLGNVLVLGLLLIVASPVHAEGAGLRCRWTPHSASGWTTR